MLLDLDQVLTKVHNYRLQRPQGSFHIEVHEVIVGKSDSNFVAVPVQAPLGLRSSEQKYHVPGDTEHEALEALVDLIKELSKEEIFPR